MAETWRLYAGDELAADLFAKELAASDAAAETDEWATADLLHYRLHSELRPVAPDGRGRWGCRPRSWMSSTATSSAGSSASPSS
jgi:hypothetical protein